MIYTDRDDDDQLRRSYYLISGFWNTKSAPDYLFVFDITFVGFGGWVPIFRRILLPPSSRYVICPLIDTVSPQRALLLLLLLNAIEFSLYGNSLYISTDKTNRNKYT
jgi:hypothetical protein